MLQGFYFPAVFEILAVCHIDIDNIVRALSFSIVTFFLKANFDGRTKYGI